MSRGFLSNADHLDNSAPPFTATTPNGFTFSCWIKLVSLAAQCVPMTIGNSGVSTNRWGILMSLTSQVGAQAFDTTSNTVNSSGTITDSVSWHLCVVTFANDDTTKTASLDGATPTSGGASRVPVMTSPVVRVGCAPNGGSAFTGLIAHVAMWDVILTNAEIATLYTNPPNYVNAAHLREYWPLTTGASPEPSIGTVGTNLTVTGTSFSTEDPFGAPVTLMGQGYV